MIENNSLCLNEFRKNLAALGNCSLCRLKAPTFGALPPGRRTDGAPPATCGLELNVWRYISSCSNITWPPSGQLLDIAITLSISLGQYASARVAYTEGEGHKNNSNFQGVRAGIAPGSVAWVTYTEKFPSNPRALRAPQGSSELSG